MTRIKWTEQRIAKLVKEGRGKGEGSEYKPWLQAQEISSNGVASRHFCLKTGRQYEFLSNVELNFFSLLAWNPDVVDIREQYPLTRQATRQVAADLGIKHPFYPGTYVETVLTVDFLVNRIRDGKNVLEAYDTKCAEDLENPRTVEKLEITRAVLEQAEIPHRIVCDDSLPKRKIEHIQWILKGAVMPGETGGVPGFFDDYCARMLLDLERAPKTLRLNQYCSSFDQRFCTADGTGLRLARILMSRRDLLPDFSQASLENAPVGSFALAGQPALRLVAGGAK